MTRPESKYEKLLKDKFYHDPIIYEKEKKRILNLDKKMIIMLKQDILTAQRSIIKNESVIATIEDEIKDLS